ncbi:small subunit ribosomal protein S4 [Allocatelliglobosispora scoriae]|uniref:Small ribosomal subunit protein uS4 n=1 Tax=Allocatelliglobosispora scoriae TaxID=643052 RepID=A0A841BRG1_9ACTN|nr:30S ribosomal protein S4 [Allocatelliglobosispora scoriae]MBB5869332.1 small subunit ribosomal protein S4 [Allocatelliglobosispora scoriae]
MNQPRPKAKISRALGIPLTRKCVRYFERRPFPPGVHGRARKKPSDFQVRLLEKQRLRHQYNVSEVQMRRAFELAHRKAGKTGENLVALLETRLDALVARAGFARTIYQARQVVGHGHITVDGDKVDIPSYRVVPGQVIAVRERSRTKAPFQIAAAGAHVDGPTAPYLATEIGELTTTLLRRPERREIPVICDEQLVVEHYSR